MSANHEPRVTRRDFHRKAAGVAAAWMLASASGQAADDATGADEQRDALVEELLRQAPGLPEPDRDELSRQVSSVLELARGLRAHHVADGVEPGFVFSPLLEDGHAG